MRCILLFCCCMLMSFPVSAREIAGVDVPETLSGEGGVVLQLNGAGIRKKLFFKIYIAELYMQNPSADVASVLSNDGQKRMVMHFLYDEVSKEKLVDAWDEGFAANTPPAKLTPLTERIQQFNEMFVTVTEGQTVVLDYVPGTGTKVTVAGTDKGVVPGKDFSDALLAIWLGEEPVTSDLKEDLLNFKQ